MNLHVDLQDHLHAGNLNHPLVMIDDFGDVFVPFANRKYLNKLNELGRAELAGDWHKYIWLHERPYRVRALWRIAANEQLSHDHYWRLVRDVWFDADVTTNIRWWNLIWGSTRPYRDVLMTDKEQSILRHMPSPVKIYGQYPNNIAWTIQQTDETYEAIVDRDRILAYFADNQEVIVLSRDVKNMAVVS